jgi:hypothetical protein
MKGRAIPPRGVRPATAIPATAHRYILRLRTGDRIVRTPAGDCYWQTTGRAAASKTVNHLIARGELAADTDLFGNPRHGQVLALAAANTQLIGAAA